MPPTTCGYRGRGWSRWKAPVSQSSRSWKDLQLSDSNEMFVPEIPPAVGKEQFLEIGFSWVPSSWKPVSWLLVSPAPKGSVEGSPAAQRGPCSPAPLRQRSREEPLTVGRRSTGSANSVIRADNDIP